AVHVRTHDVAVTRFATPNAASSGQTRRIVVSLNSKRYAETVEVQLFRSVPGGFQQFGSLTQFVPMNPKNGTTEFAFSYTFTGDDAQIGKVTFRAVAVVAGVRDALPADNEVIVINVVGTGETQLTTDGGFPGAWSPDGTRIAFANSSDGDDEIFLMNPDGSGVTRLTDNSFNDRPSGWSPNGAQILFQSDRE